MTTPRRRLGLLILDGLRRVEDKFAQHILDQLSRSEPLMTYTTAPDGAVLRACTIPTCSATYDAADGPPPGERWLRQSSPGLMLCPTHAWLFTNHTPRLDHETRTCACSCGWYLPGPTLGGMGDAWIAHAIALMEDDPGAHPCEHSVELDMCDTWECAQKLNELLEET